MPMPDKKKDFFSVFVFFFYLQSVHVCETEIKMKNTRDKERLDRERK